MTIPSVFTYSNRLGSHIKAALAFAGSWPTKARVFSVAGTLVAVLVGAAATAPSAEADTWEQEHLAPWIGVVYKTQDLHDDSMPYPVDRNNPHVVQVRANITIPCLPDNAPNGSYYAWVGIGGVYSTHMVRAGLSAEMRRDGDTPIKTYTAWVDVRSLPSFVPSSYWSYLNSFTPINPKSINISTQVCGEPIPVSIMSRPQNDGVNISIDDKSDIEPVQPDFTTTEYVFQSTKNVEDAFKNVKFSDAFITAWNVRHNNDTFAAVTQKGDVWAYDGIQPVSQTNEGSTINFIRWAIPPLWWLGQR